MKDDLYRKAKAAEDAGNAEEASRYYCEVAAMDANYKDSRSMCNVLAEEAKRLRARSDQRFADGVTAFNNNNLDDAERAFKNVMSGSHVAEAQNYMGKIKATRQAALAEQQASEANFEKGSQAFQQNDFSAARGYLKQVNSKHAAEVSALIQKMSRYEQLMSSGDTAASGKNLDLALSNYREAAGIKKDGPGAPENKVAQIEATVAAQKQAQTQPTQPLNPRTDPKPANVDALLAEAASARSRGDLKLAKEKYQEAIVAEPSNMKAIRALANIDSGTTKPVSVGAAETTKVQSDAVLASGLREFYAGNYEVSEIRLADYLSTYGSKNDSKRALVHFFLGASKLTRFYLNGAQDTEKTLKVEAQTDFRLAAETPKFHPPTAEYISPVILEAYGESTK